MSKILGIKHLVVHQFNITTEGNALPVLLCFHPVQNVPGFTHRVSIDGKATTFWLAETHRPNKHSARFFFEQVQKKVKKILKPN